MKSDLHRLLTKRASAAPGPSAAAPGPSAVTNSKGGVPPVSTGPSQSAQDSYKARLDKSPETSVGQSNGFWSSVGDGSFGESVRNYHGNLASQVDKADPNKAMNSQLWQNSLRGLAHAGDFVAGIGSSVAGSAVSAGESASRAFNEDHGNNTLGNGFRSIVGALFGNEKNMGDTWDRLKRGGGQLWNSAAGDAAGALGHGALAATSFMPSAWGAKGLGLAANATRRARIGAHPFTRGVMTAGQAMNATSSGVAGASAPVAPTAAPASAEVASNGQQAVQPGQQNGQGFDWSQLLALAPLFMGAMNGGQGGYGMPPQQDAWSQFANRPASSYYYPQQSLYGS